MVIITLPLNEPVDAGQIWKLNTTTDAWTNISPAGFTRAFCGISIDPNNPQRLLATTINTYLQQEGNTYGDRIFLSTNGGTSWVDLVARGFDLDPNGITWINGQSIHWAGSVEFDPFDTQKAWVTSGNGVFKTDNINANSNVWKFLVKGLEETVPLNIVSIPDGPLVTVIGDYDGFRHTDIAEYAPIHSPRMGTTTGLAYAPLNTTIMLRAGDKMFSSADKGNTWTERTINGKKGQVAISANGSVFLHSPEESSTTYRSINNGASWTTVSGLNFNEARPVADYVNTNKFYAYNSSTGYLMISTSAGSSFAIAGNVGTGGSKVLRTTPGKEGHVWMAMYGNGLQRSTDSGGSFSAVNSVTYCGAIGFGKEAAGSNYPTIYIWGTINNVMGVYLSTDEGQTWLRINDDAHEYGGPGNGQFVMGDMNVFGRVYMSTVGRGVVYGQISGTSTVTAIKQYNSLDLTYGANPFTGGFFIQSPKAFQYKIATIVGSELETGSAKASKTVGSKLNPGLYILSVWSGNQISTLKIIKK